MLGSKCGVDFVNAVVDIVLVVDGAAVVDESRNGVNLYEWLKFARLKYL